MALAKNTIAKTLVALVLLAIGYGAGIITDDAPFITFKREVDLSTCMSILGLFATIIIMPFVVQKKLSRQDNINSVILIDLEAINSDVTRLREIYVGLKPSIAISKAKYMAITTLFKTISSEIISLNTELERQNKLPKFKQEVYDKAYTPAYEQCTEMLVLGKKMDETRIYSANKSLNQLCSALRKYRYDTFA